MASRLTIILDSNGYTVEVRRDGKIYSEIYRVDARGGVGCINGNSHDSRNLRRLSGVLTDTGRAARDLMTALEV